MMILMMMIIIDNDVFVFTFSPILYFIFLFCQFSSDKWRFSLKKILKEQKFRSLSLPWCIHSNIFSACKDSNWARAHYIIRKKRFVCEKNLCACSLPSSSSTSTTTTTTSSINHSHQSLVFFHAKKEREMESTKKKR